MNTQSDRSLHSIVLHKMQTFIFGPEQEKEKGMADDNVETIEEQVARLNPTVRGCWKHNNPAHIEITNDMGEIIFAPECGCYQETRDFNSLEEAVNWWNDRPYVDELLKVNQEMRIRIARLEQVSLRVDQLINEAYTLASTVKYLTQGGGPLQPDDKHSVLVASDRIHHAVESSDRYEWRDGKWVPKETQ